MKNLFDKLKKQAADFQRDHHREISQMKYNCKQAFEEAKKKSTNLDQKLRIEKAFLQQKYSKSMNSHNFDSLHQKWLSFRDRNLSKNANSVFQKLSKQATDSVKPAKNLEVDKHLKTASQKLQQSGVNVEKLNSTAKKTWNFASSSFQSLKKGFNYNNLNRFFFHPVNTLGSFVNRYKRKVFVCSLLLVFFYGAGCYTPGAIKDYYLKKHLLTTYQSLKAEEEQLKMQLNFKES